MTPRTPAIVAPDRAVHAWEEAASRCLHAVRRASDPAVAPLLTRSPREVAELVAFLADALTHAGGIFLASVANARPNVAAEFAAGLRELVGEVQAAQAADRGRESDVPCPLPVDEGGTPLRCGCGPVGRKACQSIAFDVGNGALVADDRAQRDEEPPA